MLINQSEYLTTVINKPFTFPAGMTNVYTNVQTNNLIINSSNKYRNFEQALNTSNDNDTISH
jgi:hypothetical protein